MDYREDEQLCKRCGQPLDEEEQCECCDEGVDIEDVAECRREYEREQASLQLENYLRRCGS
jgi:predicted amidophosphoribosyltransferase